MPATRLAIGNATSPIITTMPQIIKDRGAKIDPRGEIDKSPKGGRLVLRKMSIAFIAVPRPQRGANRQRLIARTRSQPPILGRFWFADDEGVVLMHLYPVIDRSFVVGPGERIPQARKGDRRN